MLTYAAAFVLAAVIGLLLGSAGRFALFAVASVAILLTAVVMGIVGERWIGELVLLALAGLGGLQIGYAIRLFAGAMAIARNRRRRRLQEPAVEDVSDARSQSSHGYERAN